MTIKSGIFFCLSEQWRIKGFINQRSGFEVTDICVAGRRMKWYDFSEDVDNVNHSLKWIFMNMGIVA